MPAGPVDALLDAYNDMRDAFFRERQKSETLRDALSECLAELPDTRRWYPHQELYVLTDPDNYDDPHFPPSYQEV